MRYKNSFQTMTPELALINYVIVMEATVLPILLLLLAVFFIYLVNVKILENTSQINEKLKRLVDFAQRDQFKG